MTSSECHLKGDFCYTFQELCTANRIWKPFMAGAYEGNALMEGGTCTKTERVQEKTTYQGIILPGSASNWRPRCRSGFLQTGCTGRNRAGQECDPAHRKRRQIHHGSWVEGFCEGACGELWRAAGGVDKRAVDKTLCTWMQKFDFLKSFYWVYDKWGCTRQGINTIDEDQW